MWGLKDPHQPNTSFCCLVCVCFVVFYLCCLYVVVVVVGVATDTLDKQQKKHNDTNTTNKTLFSRVFWAFWGRGLEKKSQPRKKLKALYKILISCSFFLSLLLFLFLPSAFLLFFLFLFLFLLSCFLFLKCYKARFNQKGFQAILLCFLCCFVYLRRVLYCFSFFFLICVKTSFLLCFSLTPLTKAPIANFCSFCSKGRSWITTFGSKQSTNFYRKRQVNFPAKWWPLICLIFASFCRNKQMVDQWST